MTVPDSIKQVYIPKWPLCVIEGDKISKRQALEIIRRTDDAFSGYGVSGNNTRFVHNIQIICGMPKRNFSHSSQISFEEYWSAYQRKVQAFRDRWQYVPTNYISNTWVSSCYIDGPQGWCHPDGTIGCAFCIGKWPTFEEIVSDLEVIAAAFPFLRFSCSILDCGSDSPNKALFTFNVGSGLVCLADPENVDEARFDRLYQPNLTSLIAHGHIEENYFGYRQIKAWARRACDQCCEDTKNPRRPHWARYRLIKRYTKKYLRWE